MYTMCAQFCPWGEELFSPWLLVLVGVFTGKNVHRAMVTGDAEQGGVLVERDTGEKLGGRREGKKHKQVSKIQITKLSVMYNVHANNAINDENL